MVDNYITKKLLTVLRTKNGVTVHDRMVKIKDALLSNLHITNRSDKEQIKIQLNNLITTLKVAPPMYEDAIINEQNTRDEDAIINAQNTSEIRYNQNNSGETAVRAKTANIEAERERAVQESRGFGKPAQQLLNNSQSVQEWANASNRALASSNVQAVLQSGR